MAEAPPVTALLQHEESLAKDPKAVEDYTAKAEEAVEKARKLAQEGKLEEALETLHLVEKKARQAADARSASKLCCCALTLIKDVQEWAMLEDQVTQLCKKRSQLKRAVADMIHLCMDWINEVPADGLDVELNENEKPTLANRNTRLSLLKCLSKITDGKIFLEVERARLVRLEAQMYEDEGRIDDAAKLLQEVQVETFGAMERKEKTGYIVDQMRLVLARKDYVRCQIISKKINTKLLEADDLQDLKVSFYEYMIIYHLSNNDYFQVAECYKSILKTPKVETDPSVWREVLKNLVIFASLAELEEKAVNLLQEVKTTEKKKLAQIPDHEHLIIDLCTPRVVPWPLSYAEGLRSSTAFQSLAHESPDGGAIRWSVLEKRVTQHNVIVLSKYYKKGTLDRLATLLKVERSTLETTIAELVNAHRIHAKIDRPNGIVVFGELLSPPAILDKWTNDITDLLDILDETTHLIKKERMVAEARLKRTKSSGTRP